MKKKQVTRQAPADRIPFVEGLRGVCALYVVLGHLCSMSDPSKLAGKPDSAPLWFQQLIKPFSYGHLAVAAFIVISGFCLQLSLFAGGDGHLTSLRRFFIKRAKRILPAYYACLAVSVAVALYVTDKLPGMPFQMYLPVTQENVLAHVFLVHNYSPSMMYKLNGVLWSIAIESQLYLVFPLIIASLFRVGRWWTLVAASGAALVVMGYVPGAMKLYPWFLPLFVAGMIGANLAYRPHPLLKSPAIFRVAGLAFLGTCIYGLTQDWSIATTDVLMGGYVACLCHFGSVGRPSPIVKVLSWKPLLALGAFSYSLYLIHHPIQQMMFLIKPVGIGGPVGDFGYLLATLPVILFAAWIFWLVFEKPFMRKPLRAAARPEKGLVPVSLPLVSASQPQGRRKTRRSRSKTRPGVAVVRLASTPTNTPTFEAKSARLS